MSDRDRRPHYHVYLLRLWREADTRRAGRTLWRFSLESPHTRERFGFTSVATLAAYLRRMVRTLEPPAESSEDNKGIQ